MTALPPARPLVQVCCIASLDKARLAIAALARALAAEHGPAVRPDRLDLCSGVRRAGRLEPARLAALFAALPAA